jgi:AraC family transcriptional regulator
MDCVVVEMLPGSNPDVHFREPDVFEDVRMVHLAAMLRYEMDADDVAAPLVLEGVVLQIVANAIRVQSPRERAVPRWLDDMRGALHERSAETLRIGDVARGLGIHPTHAVREFRRRFGLTPGEYLRRVRVERAAALLRDGMSLADAAVNAGFAHPSHFSRTFKRYWHMTPQQWLSAARR